MKVSYIESLRRIINYPSWHLVFEWEDELSKQLRVPIYKPTKLISRIRRILNMLCVHSNKYRFCFEMSARVNATGVYNSRTIPFIIDYFLSDEDFHKFAECLKSVPVVFISSREAFDHISSKIMENITTKFIHLPLSLSDKYRITKDTKYTKEYDVVLMGRVSPLLKEWLDKYRLTRNISVVDRRVEDGHFNYYATDGTYVGNADTRESYMQLMKKCRVFLYATPGIDNEKLTNGFSQVTPRFLEALSCQCHVLMRYKDNSDTRFYDLKSFGPSIENYDIFKKEMDKALCNDVDVNRYSLYLEKHYTSVVVKQLNEILAKID